MPKKENQNPIIEIAGRKIGVGQPCYIVAEMSANHRGSYEEAVKILEAAAQAGADAIKLQTYTADSLTIDCDSNHFRIQGTIWEGKKLHDLYAEAATPWEWHAKLQEVAKRLGLHFFSTPFDERAVDDLESLGVPAHKIASFEIVDIPLVQRIAQTRKPVILSTGMATQEEIAEAVQTLRANGANQIALLKCTSAYPAPPESMNLRAIPFLAEQFKTVVGLSDHTLGNTAAVGAVALGASVIEKHLTLSRSSPGPDSAFSLEPHEFREMVSQVRLVEKALGTPHLGTTQEERNSRAFRRSLFVVKDVKAGEVLSAQNVRSIRPGNGLHPRHFFEILGRRSKRDIARGTPLSMDLIE